MVTAFYVYGDPQPEGDLTCRRDKSHKLYHKNQAKLHPWRDEIIKAAKLRGLTPWPAGAPVALYITYSLHRGKTVTRTYPTTIPDQDKLERAILDSLKLAGVLHDDAQVTDTTHKKRYADPSIGMHAVDHRDVLGAPGVVVRLYPGGDE